MPTFLSTDRLHLLLALVSALTGTWWGVGTAAVVVHLVLARRSARHALAGRPSAATGGGVLTTTKHSQLFHPSSRLGHHRAGA